MKKVLHISKYYYPFVGGVEQIARNCVLALKNNCEQRIICFDHEKGRGDSIDSVDDIEVIRCGQELLVASQAIGRSYKKRLKEVLEDFKPDIVIFHYPNPFVSHYLLKLLDHTTKLVVWWHLDIVKQKILKYFFYGQNRKLLNRATIVVATSPNYIDGSEWLSAFREKCVIIPNCVDENRLVFSEDEIIRAQQIREANDGKIICLAVGRHVPYKGFEYLIKATKMLDDRFVVFIAGKGPLTVKLKKLALDDQKICFIGQVSDLELKAYLIACDIYTFPSITKNEAFGLALAEGMYFEHPAITFTIEGSGVNYVSINDVTGIECPNRDTNAFARAIKRLGSETEYRTQLGKAAKNRILENFTYKQFAVNVNEMVDSV